METFNPNSITPDDLRDWRGAAEQAWGDDTRHPNFAGHPQASKGQCYVTSEWLRSRLGGHVGAKDGHYFWVAPDRSHIVDLTGDQFHGQSEIPTNPVHTQSSSEWAPGPIHMERADHPYWKGFRVVDQQDVEGAPDTQLSTPLDARRRADVFASRANGLL